mgnify:CR=1 FL=1
MSDSCLLSGTGTRYLASLQNPWLRPKPFLSNAVISQIFLLQALAVVEEEHAQHNDASQQMQQELAAQLEEARVQLAALNAAHDEELCRLR